MIHVIAVEAQGEISYTPGVRTVRVVIALGGCWLLGLTSTGEAAWPPNKFAAFHPERYERPFGPNAPWNVPVRGLARYPQSDKYRDRLWFEAPATQAGNFNLSFDEITYPVYFVSDASGKFPVRTQWQTNLNGRTMPWNPTWKPAAGPDAQVIVLDPAAGREWDLWKTSFDGTSVRAVNGNLVDGDFRTSEVGFRPSRAAGIPYLAMLVWPEEIMQGEIRHALSMPIRNTDGKIFVPPATKLDPHQPAGGIPIGMRFALDVTDQVIEAWLGTLPQALPPESIESARIIARALRDYGWFITDTSGSAHLQFEDRLTAGDKWRVLGLDKRPFGDREFPRDLLDGLLLRGRIYAIVPSDQYPPAYRASLLGN